MSYSEVSARDPIFYRWHGHIEDIMQKYRDTKLPRYSLEDFALTDPDYPTGNTFIFFLI